MQPKSAGPEKETPQRNEIRVETTKHRICQAVIHCLDEFGYSETSINAVQKHAGVSRGALTHHFPTKEDMITEVVERLLDPVRGLPRDTKPSGARGAEIGDSVDADLKRLWRKVVNTPEGRALFEILVAARTDQTLRGRITPSLHEYNDTMNEATLALYASTTLDDADISTLWAICRTFLRGLHVHARFEKDQASTDRMMDRFVEMIAPLMQSRNPVTNSKVANEKSI